MLNRIIRFFDPAFAAIFSLAYSRIGKRSPFLICFIASSALTFGQDWNKMFDLGKTEHLKTVEEYSAHLDSLSQRLRISDVFDYLIYEPMPELGDRLGHARVRSFSPQEFGFKDVDVDITEMNRRADSAGYEPCELRLALLILEESLIDTRLLNGKPDIIFPLPEKTKCARLKGGYLKIESAEYLPPPRQKQAWFRDVLRDQQKFVYRKK